MAGRNDLIQSKKAAIIVSYLMILCNTASSLLLTPMYLRYLGLERYGLYQMVYSMAHYILILDFGISTTMVKYISLYRVKQLRREEESFAAHCLAIVGFLVAAILVVGSVLNALLTRIYTSITPAEAPLAHRVFLVMVATICLTVLEHYFQGVVIAYEHFLAQKAIALLKVVGKLLFTVLFLVLGRGIVAIAGVDLLVTGLSLGLLAAYSLIRLKFRVAFRGHDRVLLGGIITFMFAIFLQSVVSYVNNMVDKTILGIMTTKTDVAIYSVSMSFITLFNSLPSVFTGVFLPQATKLVQGQGSPEQLTDFIIRPGRYQFLICGSIIAGFLLFGREFIQLWTGGETLGAWIVALIILIPNTIPLVETAVIPILDALSKRLFRSVALCLMSVLNVILTVILVGKHGILGAPIGTGLSYLLGYGLIMNIYYQRVIHIQVGRLFRSVVSRTWVCVLIAALVSFPLNLLFPAAAWGTLAVKGCAFLAVLLVGMLLYGFLPSEKRDFQSILKRLHLSK